MSALLSLLCSGHVGPSSPRNHVNHSWISCNLGLLKTIKDQIRMAKACLWNASRVQLSHKSEGPRCPCRNITAQNKWAVRRASSIATVGVWGGGHPSLKGTVRQAPLRFSREGLLWPVSSVSQNEPEIWTLL